MQPHRVISAFRAGRLLVQPGTEWTPPDQATADRMIAAGCLALPRGGLAERINRNFPAAQALVEQVPEEAPAGDRARAIGADTVDTAPSPDPPPPPDPAPPKTRKKRGRRKGS